MVVMMYFIIKIGNLLIFVSIFIICFIVFNFEIMYRNSVISVIKFRNNVVVFLYCCFVYFVKMNFCGYFFLMIGLSYVKVNRGSVEFRV